MSHTSTTAIKCVREVSVTHKGQISSDLKTQKTEEDVRRVVEVGNKEKAWKIDERREMEEGDEEDGR